MTEEKKKVYILEERDYEIIEAAPPNFFPWFHCREMWDKLDEIL
jgi:hypothetical protein